MSTQNFCGKMRKIRDFLFSPKILWGDLFPGTPFGKNFFRGIHKKAVFSRVPHFWDQTPAEPYIIK